MDDLISLSNQVSLATCESVIDQYFATLNLEQYHKTAALFARDGVLHPPVDDPVVGRAAIASYLQREAPGLRLEPLNCQFKPLPSGQTQVHVQGKVHVCPFGSNVAWMFLLNACGEIERLQIELMAL